MYSDILNWNGRQESLFTFYICSCRIMAFGGLGLIALGTGGIKPCVAAFGGDQFKEHQVILMTIMSRANSIVLR